MNLTAIQAIGRCTELLQRVEHTWHGVRALPGILVLAHDLHGPEFHEVMRETRAVKRTCAEARLICQDLNLSRATALTGSGCIAYEMAAELAASLRCANERAFLLAQSPNVCNSTAQPHAAALAADLGSIHVIAAQLATDLGQASGLGGARVRALAQVSSSSGSASGHASEAPVAGVRPTRAAQRLVDAVVRVLPEGERDRWAEELSAELFHLAAAGTPWWRQVAHALRVFDQAWELGGELRNPAARRARS